MLCPSKNTFPFIASAHRMLLYPGVGPGGRVLFPVSWKHLGGSCSPAGPALPVALTSGKPDSRPSPGCLSSSCASLSSSVCCRWGRFDIYRKVPKDLTQPTYTGAIISICCCLFILFLFLSELTGFITTEVVNELYVDDPDKDSGGKIDVSLNISLPNLHCELVGLDIQDEMGRHEVGHIDNSMKIPLNNGAGCRFEGQFSINKNQELQILSQVGERSALGRAEAPGGSWQGFAQHVPALLEARYCHSGASQQRCEAAPFDRSPATSTCPHTVPQPSHRTRT
ncbi:endoplasmic reticulum-Golgi intermediate compartment protein 1 isoform X7 [Papio anubis]|uniref:endoplasmic reticulum-Golgi intermediate compartment protein 1 isoform X7 n=1 Tax=Papio anubis TaxID=9555 RepID=UPI000B7B5D73|nr:endoplasmic reticulum-Golgi intermediate compartment protein 1 isoform X7 [Papio anubis]